MHVYNSSCFIIIRFQDRDVSGSFLGAIDSMSSVLLNKTVGNQTVSLDAPGLNVAMKKASNETDDGLLDIPTIS